MQEKSFWEALNIMVPFHELPFFFIQLFKGGSRDEIGIKSIGICHK